MMKAGLLFSAVASAVLAGGLNAQDKPAKADSTCTKYSDGRVECRVYKRWPGDSAYRNMVVFKMDSALAKRAALGLELRTTGTKRDTLGVFVERVTPKGPAELAGIVEGDRIAAINGVDVRTSAADAEDDYATELGSRRLTREVQKLTPGTRATLRVWSGGRYHDVQVTTGKASEVMRLGGNRFNYRMPMGMMQFGGPGMMKFGPEMQLMRERMPMLKEQLEPMLREKLRDLPRKTELRTAPRIRMAMPVGDVFTFDDVPDFDPSAFAFDFDEAFDFDFDYEPFDFQTDFSPVSPEEIRELVVTTVLDARVGLERLAADGIA